MKKRQMRILLVCAVAIAARPGLRAQGPDERVQNLVVMLDGELGDSPTLGAGIIFGTGQDRLYIVTANHVVRRGADQAKEIKAQLKWLPGEPQPATLLTTSDPNLDLAVLVVTGLNKIGVTNGTVPFDLLGDASSLKRGDTAHTLGYPSGRAWDMPVSEDKVATAAGGSIRFESAFLYPGNSGGALLNGKYELIGLVLKDDPPTGEAAAIDTIMDKLRSWGYPISLRLSSASAVVASASVNGGGTAANQTSPNFAGTWESFEVKWNGAVDPRVQVGNRFTITQNGTTVNIGSNDLSITAAGTVTSKPSFWASANTTSGWHQVSTEAQAGRIMTSTWRIEGDILVAEATFLYKNQYGSHPPGTDVRIMKYRRVSADISATPPAAPQPIAEAACHIKDVVFVGRSGSVHDALAKVTIDSIGPTLAGQAITVSVAFKDRDHLVSRRLETYAQPGTMILPSKLSRGVLGGGVSGQVEEGRAVSVMVSPRELGSYFCEGDFPIRFQ